MDTKLETVINLAERIVSQLGTHVPPEVEAVEELKRLIPEIRKEHGLPSPISKSVSGTA